MTTRKATICICDQCGHKWLPEGKKLPPRCASCKARTWNRKPLKSGPRPARPQAKPLCPCYNCQTRVWPQDSDQHNLWKDKAADRGVQTAEQFARDWKIPPECWGYTTNQQQLIKLLAMCAEAYANSQTERLREENERLKLKETGLLHNAAEWSRQLGKVEQERNQLRTKLREACGMMKFLDREGERQAVTDFLTEVSKLIGAALPAAPSSAKEEA